MRPKPCYSGLGPLQTLNRQHLEDRARDVLQHHHHIMRDYTHTDLELLYMLADGIDGEEADPGSTQELRDLEAEGPAFPESCSNTAQQQR